MLYKHKQYLYPFVDETPDLTTIVGCAFEIDSKKIVNKCDRCTKVKECLERREHEKKE